MHTAQLMVDIAGTELTPEDREILRHPAVAGVILFTRNFIDPLQLINLTESIHELRDPPLIIALDHEGGRVQRFNLGFSTIPPMRRLGQYYDECPGKAMQEVELLGRIMGHELRMHGIDYTFAPVLDIDAGISEVIGDRAFHRDPETVALMGRALVRGLHQSQTGAVAKHFPGHGFVSGDSHTTIPEDTRDFATINEVDLTPFKLCIRARVDGIMPAHVIYSKVDPQPAGFSSFWLKTVLRKQLRFEGIIFSDDLCMEGASPAGDIIARVQRATAAGCDILLICNDRQKVERVLAYQEEQMACRT